MSQTNYQPSLWAVLPEVLEQMRHSADGRVVFPAVHVAPRAGQIPVLGLLGQAKDFADTSYSSIAAQLARGLNDKSVKEITLFFDSPGGAVAGLPELASTIAHASRIKPVSGRVVGMCASAAFWLASQCGTISVTPSGSVGSVGIVDTHLDLSGAFEKSGVKPEFVIAGKHKLERDPRGPLNPEARKFAQENVDRVYGEFLSAVRRGRGSRVDPLSKFGDGRLLDAKSALKAGLVDFVR